MEESLNERSGVRCQIDCQDEKSAGNTTQIQESSTHARPLTAWCDCGFSEIKKLVYPSGHSKREGSVLVRMPGREGGREGGLSVDDWLVYVSGSISYAAAIKEFHISEYS